MSIYCTLGVFAVKPDGFFGDGWVDVIVQGVPPHIGHPDYYPEGDPYADFLPPPCEDKHSARMRAVFVVHPDTEKRGQQYVDPLLMLTGEEWDTLSFPEVWQRVEDAVAEAFAHGRCKTCGRSGSE